MFTKKRIALIMSLLAGAAAFAGCGEEAASEVSVPEITAAEETAAAVSEGLRIAETVSETETETESETESETTSETDSTVTEEAAEPSVENAAPFTYGFIGLDPDTFLPECNDKTKEEILAAARKALEGNARYEEFMSYDPETSDVELDISDEFIVDGECQAKMFGSLYRDFDGDGANEAFIMFYLPMYWNEIGQPDDGNYFVVFVNSDCEAEIIYQGYGTPNGVIEYDGFKHLVISGGISDDTMRTEIFSVKNGHTVKEYSYNRGIQIDDEKEYMFEMMPEPPEVYNAFMWDSTKECYVFFDLPAEEVQEERIEW